MSLRCCDVAVIERVAYVNVPQVPGGRLRHVPVETQLLRNFVPALRLYLDQHHTEDLTAPLLPSYWRGGESVRSAAMSVRGVIDVLQRYLDTQDSIWDDLRDETGRVRVSVLDLRRTHARSLEAAGVPMDDIQRRLGHRTRHTTWEYVYG